MSNKVNKYLDDLQDKNYAPRKRKLEKSDIREFKNRKIEAEMKDKEKKKVIQHIKKDDKEFRSQIKDDAKLVKSLKKK